MMTYYRTDDQVIHEEEKLSDGVWVQMINPTHDECEEIAEKLMVDIDDVKAALDVEESSRIELQDGYTLILVDIPAIEIRHDQRTYTTIPLGIILTQDIIVTICTEDTPVLQNFVNNRVKEFSTKKKMRFVYQILFRTATNYQMNLRVIDKKRTEIEERIGKNTEDIDPEDNRLCPFQRLHLISRHGKNYIRETQFDISGYAVLYAMKKQLQLKEPLRGHKVQSISIDELLQGCNSPGRLLNLTRISLNDALDELQNKGYLHVDRTAGLDMVYIAKDLPDKAEQIVKMYYEIGE